MTEDTGKTHPLTPSPRHLVILLVVAGVLIWAVSAGGSADRLVVYCAHDALYAEQILREFERQSGIPVDIKFDTEATKSLGLVNLIIREKAHPRCDVFWNNQALGTMDLQAAGLLVPYRGAGFKRIPDRYKDPDGHWAGFAARLRVYIVNTDRMPASETAIEAALAGDLSRMAVAKPLYGTTRSHYTVLWQLWGAERLKEWHNDVRQRGVRETDGNAQVKNLVAAGTCDFGWTDTDDFFVAKDEGQPVEALPIRVDDGKTIAIPNTVAIIQGTKQLAAAQRLVDFLLSAETELALARSKSRQIPLGMVDENVVPEDVRPLVRWAADGVDLSEIAAARDACLEWLQVEYTQ